MKQQVQYCCECTSQACRLKADIPAEEAAAFRHKGCIAIVDGCTTGPDPTDVLVEEKPGYAWYREHQPS